MYIWVVCNFSSQKLMLIMKWTSQGPLSAVLAFIIHVDISVLKKTNNWDKVSQDAEADSSITWIMHAKDWQFAWEQTPIETMKYCLHQVFLQFFFLQILVLYAIMRKQLD